MILINQGNKKWWLEMLQINNINQIINANGNYYGWKKSNLQPLGNKTQEYKKQLQTSASRGSYINNVKKKKSNKTYRNFKLITSDTEFRASTFTL